MNISDSVSAPSNSSEDIPVHFSENISIHGVSINLSPRRDLPNPPSSIDFPSPSSIFSLSQTINTFNLFPDKVESPSPSSSIRETPHQAPRNAEVSPHGRNDDKVFPQASNDATIVPSDEIYPGENGTVQLSPSEEMYPGGGRTVPLSPSEEMCPEEDRTVPLSPAPHQVLTFHFKEISCV